MPPDATRFLLPERGFNWIVWFGLALYTLLLFFFVRANSYFIDDDYDHFIQAAQLPLWRIISTPIDVHFVPFHQLFSALITHAAPLNFDVALLVMLAFHGISLCLLYKILQTFSDSPVNLLIVFLYGCSPFLLYTLMWWSSGMHRLPYICLCLSSLYAYVHYRRSRCLWHLASCYLTFFLAFGFYSKAILIPVYILGLELCLSSQDGLRHFFRRFLPGASMLLLSMAYVFWYLNFAPVMQQGPAPSIAVTSEIVLLNFKVMLGVLTLHQSTAASPGFNLLLGLLLLVGVFYCAVRDRRAVVIWLALFSCIFASFAIVAASGRGQMFGGFLALVLRYYFEVMFLVAIFAGLLFSVLHRSSTSQVASPKTWHWLGLLVCAAYVCALGVVSWSNYLVTYEKSYVATAHYMQRLIADMDHLPADRPIRLAEASLPGYVYGDFINAQMAMGEVLPLRYPRLVMVPRAQADYEIDEAGSVIPLHGDTATRAP